MASVLNAKSCKVVACRSNQGVKGIENEGKEGMADYKKDQGNKAQFAKDEAANLKGVSLQPSCLHAYKRLLGVICCSGAAS